MNLRDNPLFKGRDYLSLLITSIINATIVKIEAIIDNIDSTKSILSNLLSFRFVRYRFLLYLTSILYHSRLTMSIDFERKEIN